ncbi:MAG: bifunctional riboflavin kinase/FAD synthetase [bacterium]|nr:bifunctional riboflavin kinase/FAD synthetase [bacterium]
MKIWNALEALPDGPVRCVASIGNYDGVHVGHRAILARVVERAAATGVRSLLITFDPHPLSIVAPQHAPSLLQTRRQKLDSLEATGLSDVVVLTFDESIAALSGEEFFEDYLMPRLSFVGLHVGGSFRFGKARSGDLTLLRRLGERHAFAVEECPAIEIGGETVSSTAVRKAVAAGDVDRAQRMLGRPFALTGEVIRGAGRGRQLDFPTANLEPDNDLLPASGVYVTDVAVRAARYGAMTNIGVRPTFGGRTLSIESHLLGFSDELYNERMEVRFLARLRGEMRFSSPAELADQIARDQAATESFFHNAPLI